MQPEYAYAKLVLQDAAILVQLYTRTESGPAVEKIRDAPSEGLQRFTVGCAKAPASLVDIQQSMPVSHTTLITKQPFPPDMETQYEKGGSDVMHMLKRML